MRTAAPRRHRQLTRHHRRSIYPRIYRELGLPQAAQAVADGPKATRIARVVGSLHFTTTVFRSMAVSRSSIRWAARIRSAEVPPPSVVPAGDAQRHGDGGQGVTGLAPAPCQAAVRCSW
jgi:hypothetical protein